jgi:hypothetical protein
MNKQEIKDTIDFIIIGVYLLALLTLLLFAIK